MFKRRTIYTLLWVCVAGLASAGNVAFAKGQQRAAIQFADVGNIRNWQPDGDEALYIQAQNGRWYRATFFRPCWDLPYTDVIAFVTEPNGSLDSFSSILVERDRCYFKSFEASSKPTLPDGIGESK